jgi:4,5-epoxidase
MASDEHATVVAKHLGEDALSILIADHDPNRPIMVVRPDAHLGWRGPADPDALDQWLTTVTRHGRAS